MSNIQDEYTWHSFGIDRTRLDRDLSSLDVPATERVTNFTYTYDLTSGRDLTNARDARLVLDPTACNVKHKITELKEGDMFKVVNFDDDPTIIIIIGIHDILINGAMETVVTFKKVDNDDESEYNLTSIPNDWIKLPSKPTLKRI